MIEEFLNTIAYSPLTWAAFGLAFVLFALKLISDHAPGAKAPPVIRLSENPGLNRMGWLAVFMSPIWLILILVTIWSLYNLIIGGPAEDQLANRVHYLAFVGLMGALGGLVTLPFTLVRAFTTERQTRAQETGLITDRINKAVENLGATRLVKQVVETPRYKKTNGEWECDENGILVQAKRPDGQAIIDRQVIEYSEPNIEVRIGAIHALARIACDDLNFHVEIMEILCAYIRHNAPLRDDLPAFPEPENDEQFLSIWHKIIDWKNKLPGIGDDIQTALTILGTRNPDQLDAERTHQTATGSYAHDLRRTCLVAADLQKLNLDRARLNGAQLQGANLRKAQLQGADLEGAQLQGASLWGAQLQRANLVRAQLQGANLWGAQLQGAHLGRAQLQGAILQDAQMQGADLRAAQLQGADLRLVDLQGANLQEAQLYGATLRWAQLQGADLSEAQLRRANLLGAKLQRANLRKAQLQGADLQAAQLRGADLQAAHVDSETIVTDTVVQFASVHSADLSNLTLSQEQIDSLYGDGSVTIPDSLTRPGHWPEAEFGAREFLARWRAWQRDNGFDLDQL